MQEQGQQTGKGLEEHNFKVNEKPFKRQMKFCSKTLKNGIWSIWKMMSSGPAGSFCILSEVTPTIQEAEMTFSEILWSVNIYQHLGNAYCIFMTFHTKSQVIDLAHSAPKERKQVTSEGKQLPLFSRAHGQVECRKRQTALPSDFQ